MSIFSRIKDLKRGLTVNHAEIESVLVTEPPSDVAKAIEHWADNQSRWSIESRDEITGGIEIQLTRTTLVLRFIDDVQVRLLADGDWTLVDAASQSRVGKGDLGQNRRNLQELLNVFKNTTLARGGRGDDR